MNQPHRFHDAVQIKEPPKTWFGALRFIGPGIILSAAIVGSGELIATTTLGTRAGFALLWVILFGCLAKTAVQVEYGRACILTGETTLQSWNRHGALFIGRQHWTVLVALFFLLFNFAGQAGVLGGAAQVGTFLFPAVPAIMWAVVLVILLGVIVSLGRYESIETIAMILNGVFIATILYCVFRIQGTEYRFTSNDLMSGLQFHLPHNLLPLAVAAFGITGVAAGEISLYPYWCLEKGYAAWTGPRDDSPDWKRRAHGWTRVMIVDALVSMVIFTIATLAFYILGAAVLQSRADQLQDGNAFIEQLSEIFTQVLGESTRIVFMLCAFTVLFSTVFANIAGFSRMWADYFGILRWIDSHSPAARRRAAAGMAWVFAIASGLIYAFVQQPLLLVVIMGVVNSLFLIVVAYQTILSRYVRNDPAMKPSTLYDAALWISLLSIGFMAARSVLSLFQKG
ncbi:MAG: divalent metal cation transporter [bacterium]|nr:divalent metal cation transporter [bacterium]